ncbi:acylphosphatase [Malonomonas rubra]|uniref:acylphosphatase n=1 Tax=Malonomonas rubra TaxID=57040 RepID=UPI0026F30058|nr:acylphosphatase [Malonomonas rubra]
MSQTRASIRVTGRVQGVWFRQSTKNMADQLGLTGWVRNNPDNSVSAVFEGPRETVKKAIEWCKHGPDLAFVDELQIEWQEATGEYELFHVVR